jgi:hypothetical protein
MATRSAERVDFLAGVLTTAVEGGIGYWSMAEGYTWEQDEHGMMTEARVQLHPIEGEFKPVNVTIDTIAKGIGLVSRPDFKVRDDIRRWVIEGSRTNDGGNVDSNCADVIVQAALFGEIVYG